MIVNYDILLICVTFTYSIKYVLFIKRNPIKEITDVINSGKLF